MRFEDVSWIIDQEEQFSNTENDPGIVDFSFHEKELTEFKASEIKFAKRYR